MATTKKLKLKLLVDKEKEKVIFAESDKDFVDILFSFLTMPLGSIIRILDKQSLLGCMDELYESIENLDDCYFSTEACKQMLLRPLNACGLQCEDLILRIDDTNPRTTFHCKKYECRNNYSPFFSLITKTRCECGEIMDLATEWIKKEHKGPNGDGVFLKGTMKFIISDDLVVMPSSTMNMQHLLEKHRIKDFDNLEETCMDLDVIMLRDLLKRSLLFKSPLSGIYFQKMESVENPELRTKGPKFEDSSIDKESKRVKAKIFVCKSSNKVLYAETGGGFVNLLLSILTLPLGTVVELLNKFSSIGCFDNLYRSVENLCYDSGYFKPDACNLLLYPKLAAHFSQSDSLFYVNEMSILTGEFSGHNNYRSYTVAAPSKSIEMNPKLQSSGGVGGNYANMETKFLFLITDDLQIKPFSALCAFQTIQSSMASFAAFEEKEIDIDEVGALKILKACVTSQAPLSDAFLQKK